MSEKQCNLPATVEEVGTPCFLVDVDRLKRNAQRMRSTCNSLRVELRCHTKTHKTVEGAIIQTGGTRRKIACSTLAECELYADNGFDDILLAYPITSQKMPRCAALANRLDAFHVLLSSKEGLRSLKDGLENLVEGKSWSVFLELDCGYGRTGLPYDCEDVVHVARALEEERPRLRLQGLYTHCGQSYCSMSSEERKADQKTLVNRLLEAAKRLRAVDITVPVVGTGSTPTCSLADTSLSSLDEFHPGNYIFYDYEQLLLGSCQEEELACCVATRVVCQRRDLGFLVVDCGFLALSHDGMRQRPDDFCLFKGHPELKLFAMSQELGKVKAKEGHTIDFERYPVRTLLFVYPYHSCATAALHHRYLVHSGPKIEAAWTPVKGW